jgi:hypothetical protein
VGTLLPWTEIFLGTRQVNYFLLSGVVFFSPFLFKHFQQYFGYIVVVNKLNNYYYKMLQECVITGISLWRLFVRGLLSMGLLSCYSFRS